MNEWTQIYNETTVESLTRLCTYLPQNYQSECNNLVRYLAPIIAAELYHHVSVDMVCYSIGLCYPANGKMCHLFPLPEQIRDFVPRQPIISDKSLVQAFPWICYLPGIYRSGKYDDTLDIMTLINLNVGYVKL